MTIRYGSQIEPAITCDKFYQLTSEYDVAHLTSELDNKLYKTWMICRLTSIVIIVVGEDETQG